MCIHAGALTCSFHTEKPTQAHLQATWSLATHTTGSVFRHADSQFNLRLSGWEMKGLTNLLRWADSVNGCHNSFPSHACETYLWKESLAKWEGEQSLVPAHAQRQYQTLLWVQFGSSRRPEHPHYLKLGTLQKKELKLFVHFSKLSKGAAALYTLR